MTGIAREATDHLSVIPKFSSFTFFVFVGSRRRRWVTLDEAEDLLQFKPYQLMALQAAVQLNRRNA